MVRRRERDAYRSSSPWARAFRDIFVVSIGKGQFPLAIIGLIVLSLIWKMPAEDMHYCIIILAFVAILHFVYESIIAPSLRLELRYELFRLADEVRLLKFKGSGVTDSHLCELQDSINSLIRILFRFDLITVGAISEAIDRDADLKRRVEARARMLGDCVLPKVLEIRSKQFQIAMKILAVNSGPMLLWSALPVSLSVGYRAFHRQIENSLTVPGADLKRFLPEECSRGVRQPA